MTRRSKTAPFRLEVSFETTRISAHCLIDVYDHLVPIVRHPLRVPRSPDPGGAEPRIRRADHA